MFLAYLVKDKNIQFLIASLKTFSNSKAAFAIIGQFFSSVHLCTFMAGFLKNFQ
jgi:hypothetical protein